MNDFTINMKNILAFIFILSFSIINAQTKKVAILDFENTSGKIEYDGLGKSLSSMLITDLQKNIPRNKIRFYERGQLNKILDEQNLQKSKAFDKKTAIDFGKLSGSDYVFVGTLFVLKGTCNISSRLVDVQTSEILLTKDVNGKIEEWNNLKSQLAKSIAKEINNPITIESSIKEKSMSFRSIQTYSLAMNNIDDGKYDDASSQITRLNGSSDIDDLYIIKLERQIQRANFNNFNYISKAIKDDNFDCNVVSKIMSQIHPLITYDHMSVEKMSKYNSSYPAAICEGFSEMYENIGLHVDSHEDLQDILLERLDLFMGLTDEIIGLQKKLTCFGNGEYKEEIIFLLLHYISSLIGMDDLDKDTYYTEFLFEKYKFYYLKLIEINPKSSVFDRISFQREKGKCDEFILGRNYFRFLKKNFLLSKDSILTLDENLVDTITNFTVYKDTIGIFRNVKNDIVLCLVKPSHNYGKLSQIDSAKLKQLPTFTDFENVRYFIDDDQLKSNHKEKIINFFGSRDHYSKSNHYRLRNISYGGEDGYQPLRCWYWEYDYDYGYEVQYWEWAYNDTHHEDEMSYFLKLENEDVVPKIISINDYKDLVFYDKYDNLRKYRSYIIDTLLSNSLIKEQITKLFKWSDWKEIFDWNQDHLYTTIKSLNRPYISDFFLVNGADNTVNYKIYLLKIIIIFSILDDLKVDRIPSPRIPVYEGTSIVGYEKDVDYQTNKKMIISLLKPHALLLYSELFNAKILNQALDTYAKIDYKQKIYKSSPKDLLISDLNILLEKNLISSTTKKSVIKKINKN